MTDREVTDVNSELIKAIKSLERTIQQKCHLMDKMQSTAPLKKKDSSLRSMKEKNTSEQQEHQSSNATGTKVKFLFYYYLNSATYICVLQLFSKHEP